MHSFTFVMVDPTTERMHCDRERERNNARRGSRSCTSSSFRYASSGGRISFFLYANQKRMGCMDVRMSTQEEKDRKRFRTHPILSFQTSFRNLPCVPEDSNPLLDRKGSTEERERKTARSEHASFALTGRRSLCDPVSVVGSRPGIFTSSFWKSGTRTLVQEHFERAKTKFTRHERDLSSSLSLHASRRRSRK